MNKNYVWLPAVSAEEQRRVQLHLWPGLSGSRNTFNDLCHMKRGGRCRYWCEQHMHLYIHHLGQTGTATRLGQTTYRIFNSSLQNISSVDPADRERTHNMFLHSSLILTTSSCESQSGCRNSRDLSDQEHQYTQRRASGTNNSLFL